MTLAPAGNRIVLARVFWIAVGLAALTAAAAIFTARDLVYDGAYYLLGVASGGRFQFYEPERLAVQALQQCFAVAGARFGVHDLRALSVLFALGVSGWPAILMALCWFVLSRDRKAWIAGPLVSLVFAIPTTSFIGIGEGIIAACLLWLAFLLVEFRARNPAGALAVIAAIAACCFSHESMVLGLLVLAAASVLRARESRGFCRAALSLAAAIALAGAVNMARWILFPLSAAERGDFLAGMLGGFLGSPWVPNIPAMMSVVAACACAAAFARGGRHARAAIAASIAIFAVLLAVLAAEPGAAMSASRFFAARALPVGLTTVLAGAFLLLRRRGSTPTGFITPPVLAIVLSLAVAQAAAQMIVTVQWARYVHALGDLVGTETGVISHAEAMKRLDPDGSRFRRELLESWSVEPLSILLAPQGRVQAFVVAAPQARWVPYDPGNRATLPHAPGLDWSGFSPRPAP